VYVPLLQSLASPAAASSSTSQSTTSTAVEDVNNMFLQLLTAQLKSQSPISPLDPNQFVGQLAQFNSLSELTQIRDLMQTLVKIASPK
jgi:flagellar basal-body rod modification protein FlgD